MSRVYVVQEKNIKNVAELYKKIVINTINKNTDPAK